MDEQMVREYLKVANKHVALGEANVEQQRQRVGDLERDGHPVELARELLQTLEDSLNMHRADRDRLARELAQAERATA